MFKHISDALTFAGLVSKPGTAMTTLPRGL